MAISGGVVVVGAVGEMVAGYGGAGRAYIYTTTGSLLATLVSPGVQSGGEFGASVAVSGSRLIVGAPGESAAGQAAAGHAYLYRTTGAVTAVLTSPLAEYYGRDNYSLFGASVAINGPFAVVGAAQEDAPGFPGAGHAYVFRASTGGLEQVLTSPVPGNGGDFGSAVAISGRTVVVGAQFENVGSFSESGRAYGFRVTTGALTAVFAAPSQANQSFFGAAVSVSQGLVVIGAPNAPHGSQIEAGEVYAYNLTGALVSAIVSPNAQAVGFFGNGVGVSGPTVVFGAPDEAASGIVGAGHAYVS